MKREEQLLEAQASFLEIAYNSGPVCNYWAAAWDARQAVRLDLGQCDVSVLEIAQVFKTAPFGRLVIVGTDQELRPARRGERGEPEGCAFFALADAESQDPSWVYLSE